MKLAGFIIAFTIMTAAALGWAWLLPSAILSFINWEWLSITSTYWGRVVFVLFAAWELRSVFKQAVLTYRGQP